MRPAWHSAPRSLLVAALALAIGPAVAVSQAPAPAKVDPAQADRERAEREKAEKIRSEKEKEKAATPEAGKRGSTPAPTVTDERATEDRALALVRDHLPELAEVLVPLKTTHPAEYRKAIAELANDARILSETKTKNPARYPFALDSWKARTRVELIAALLARAPSPEREKQLRDAIRERVEADIRRHGFEFDQAEAAVARQAETLRKAEANRDRARAAFDRAKEGRDGRIEARFRSLFDLAKKATPPPQTAAGPMPHGTVPVPHD